MIFMIVVIVWAWGLTPLWANIVVTALAVLTLIWRFFVALMKGYAKDKNKNNVYSGDSYGR